ncbi:MAG: TVP38/TMEM64 family protein [Gemmataceae bacterium]|nr:TVP38/TMEM64 family protein [Gemmataceae bacterium]
MSGARAKAILKLTLLIIILVPAIYVLIFHQSEVKNAIQNINRLLQGIDPGLARLLYVLTYVAGTVLLVPGVLMSFVGAVLFGVWEGTLYTWIGATIGATLAFLLAKALGRDFVDQLLGGRLQALDQRLRDHGFVSLLIIRLVPLFPFNGINFGCGFTSIRWRDYVLATAIGIVPGTFVYQYLFATVGRRVIDEGLAWSDLADVNVLLPLGVFVAFGIATALLARKLRS